MKKITSAFALMFVLSCPMLASAEDHEAKAEAEAHAKSEKHTHKHGKNCGHKAEAHGDHTDYHHEVDGKVHHHKKHGKHLDECEGTDEAVK